MKQIRRLYVEKKKGFDVEARALLQDLRDNLGISRLEDLRILYRYDMQGVDGNTYQSAKNTIFSEPPVDHVYEEQFITGESEYQFGIEYLPGQYDQRADSAAQCLQIISQEDPPLVRTARIIVLKGHLDDHELKTIKTYCINPVDSREAELTKPVSLETVVEEPEDVCILTGFRTSDDNRIRSLCRELDLAMSAEDLLFCREYFLNTEHRDPTITEIRMLDTYWSDHCRHTTFLTEIERVHIEQNPYSKAIESAYQDYLEARKSVYAGEDRPVCLMDIALMGMKVLRKRGLLDDLDVSDEINACSINVTAKVNGKPEDWLVMFKNETHNHPTEIEPFGGAATCLGGAIRDPLSGRTYVYQAMRVTGSADPRRPVSETLPGKLPQRKITTEAAHGYSSYGNQIGIATGQVTEIYDEGYLAKRMEIGAVIGAAPKHHVCRKQPEEGDIMLLVGGRTGRDGIGGATGSSKAHTEHALKNEAEVQKGNPPVERKLQRLFRIPEVSRMIKKCNDFGAGGVSVAIGELTDGLDIYLDKVPKKYEGLDGTELALSESQERMAVVLENRDLARFLEYTAQENLEATKVADVRSHGRLKMFWRGKAIVDISRVFLNSNGVRQRTKVVVGSVSPERNYFLPDKNGSGTAGSDLKSRWLSVLGALNIADQRGLVERFDSTIGAGTVLHPLGGRYQNTPVECMAAKLPVREGETTTASLMSFGFNPAIARWSPFHGAVYAVLEAVARIVAGGGDYTKIRLTLQEYFEKLRGEPLRWGKPFAALLGAFHIQNQLGIPAIGGKDSMSGSFNDLDVPPTLVAFAVAMEEAEHILSPEIKNMNSTLAILHVPRNNQELPDFGVLQTNYTRISKLVKQKKILAAQTVREGGIAVAVSRMCMGNRIGVAFADDVDPLTLFSPEYGSLVVEIPEDEPVQRLLKGTHFRLLGRTVPEAEIRIGRTCIALTEIREHFEKPLLEIFPTRKNGSGDVSHIPLHTGRFAGKNVSLNAKPRVFIPVFPGTNCEYDSARMFQTAGGVVDTFVMKNLSQQDVAESIQTIARKIREAQILMLPGGFSAGDEPEGSGKFIAAVFRNPGIADAVMELLGKRDGLILGICNGFQALIKLGLVPYGDIREMKSDSPTLTFNRIGRHVSRMVMTKIVSVKSPWFSQVEAGDIHVIPVSHGEGRFVADSSQIRLLAGNGQIATQYVDFFGDPVMDDDFNPNGSYYSIEGITSPDGRVLGKMGHSERMGLFVGKNIPGVKDQKIFASGIAYFR